MFNDPQVGMLVCQFAHVGAGGSVGEGGDKSHRSARPSQTSTYFSSIICEPMVVMPLPLVIIASPLVIIALLSSAIRPPSSIII